MRDLLATWKREPALGLVGVVSGLIALGMGPYLWVRQWRHTAVEPGAFIWDFSYFYRAAERFAADPLTLYADPEFLYPPPSVLAFLPWRVLPETAAYFASVVANALLMAGCGMLAVRLWERHAGRVPVGARWTAVLFALAAAPTFQTLKFGQVGPLVLLSGLGALAWLGRRPAAAGLVVAAGFWLKLYPLALAPLGLMRAGRVRFAAGLAAGLVALPLVLLPVLPGPLYAEYARERLPAVRATTYTFALNQSLPAVLERAARPASAFIDRSPVEASPAVGGGSALVGVGLLGGVLLAAARGGLGLVPAGFMVLALLPVFIPLGWEHSYVLALPLVQAALLAARGRPGQAAAVAAALCLLPPMPPHALLVPFVEAGLRPLPDLFCARFPLGVALAAAVLVRHEPGRETRANRTFGFS